MSCLSKVRDFSRTSNEVAFRDTRYLSSSNMYLNGERSEFVDSEFVDNFFGSKFRQLNAKPHASHKAL